jgi:hypothetical protein
MTQDLYRDILGIPPPPETSLEVFSKLIIDTVAQVNKRLRVTHHRVPDEPSWIIYLSLSFYPPDEWESKFTYFRRIAFHAFTTPAIFWAAIAMGLYTLTIGEAYKKFDPSFDLEKYLLKPIPTPAPQEIGPELTTTPSVGATLKKVISKVPKRRFPTVTEYILFHAPSKSYELIYSTTLGCTKNKRSSKGKKVYPYGQAYIETLTPLSLRTVERAWSWLRKQGIFNKARNENPKEHHCALWYVCTSMKQIPYFRDPENRHRKSKRQN